jgi:hypothetical protein
MVVGRHPRTEIHSLEILVEWRRMKAVIKIELPTLSMTIEKLCGHALKGESEAMGLKSGRVGGEPQGTAEQSRADFTLLEPRISTNPTGSIDLIVPATRWRPCIFRAPILSADQSRSAWDDSAAESSSIISDPVAFGSLPYLR